MEQESKNKSDRVTSPVSVPIALIIFYLFYLQIMN